MPESDESPPSTPATAATAPRTALRTKRVVLGLLKLLVVLAVFWGLHRTIGRGLDDLSDLAWKPSQLRWGMLTLAGIVYLLGLTPAGLFWWQVLHRLGQHPGVLETLRAYFIGHLGKYVPGKALVVILRAGMIRSERVETGVAAASVFCETLTMMAVGAFVGGAVVVLLFSDQLWLVALAIGLMLAAGLPTIPPVFVALAKLAFRLKGMRTESGTPKTGGQFSITALERLDYRTLAWGWGGNLVGWALVGISLWLTVSATGFAHSGSESRELLVCTGAAALAMVAGFASLIPGGLGVRDAVLLVLLVPTFGQAGALVATILARLVWLVAEVTISIILYLWGRSTRPPTTHLR